jgi:hypothetical protein
LLVNLGSAAAKLVSVKVHGDTGVFVSGFAVGKVTDMITYGTDTANGIF